MQLSGSNKTLGKQIMVHPTQWNTTASLKTMKRKYLMSQRDAHVTLSEGGKASYKTAYNM